MKNIIKYEKTDERWKDIPINNMKETNTTMAKYGDAFCCLATIKGYFSNIKTIDKSILTSIIKKYGRYKGTGNTLYVNCYREFAKDNGLKFKEDCEITDNMIDTFKNSDCIGIIYNKDGSVELIVDNINKKDVSYIALFYKDIVEIVKDIKEAAANTKFAAEEKKKEDEVKKVTVVIKEESDGIEIEEKKEETEVKEEVKTNNTFNNRKNKRR